jgi:hypothetical protein
MDASKYAPARWALWATVACLAALVACLGELLFVERARIRLLREQDSLAQAAMQSADEQLQAEQIIGRRQLELLRQKDESRAAQQVVLLAPPEGSTRRISGAVVWDSADGEGLVRLAGLPGQPPQRDYQLWLDGRGPGHPADCAVFHVQAGQVEELAHIHVVTAFDPGDRFVIVDGAKGGAVSFTEAVSGGSIVLASLPYSGRIPNP